MCAKAGLLNCGNLKRRRFSQSPEGWEGYELVHLGRALGIFAGLTAVLAKVGVENVNSNLATAIRTVVILVFAWSVALFTKSQPLSTIGKRTWIFLTSPALLQAYLGYAIFEYCKVVKLPGSPP